MTHRCCDCGSDNCCCIPPSAGIGSPREIEEYNKVKIPTATPIPQRKRIEEPKVARVADIYERMEALCEEYEKLGSGRAASFTLITPNRSKIEFQTGNYNLRKPDKVKKQR